MQDLHTKIDTLDIHVKALVRKLEETLRNNNLLKNENNKLKQELQFLENKVSENGNPKNPKEFFSNDKTAEIYKVLKNDVAVCIQEINDCIQLMD